MEPNGIATAFEHDAFHIVIEQDPGRPSQHGERLDVAADVLRRAGIQETVRDEGRPKALRGASPRAWRALRECSERLHGPCGVDSACRSPVPARAAQRIRAQR